MLIYRFAHHFHASTWGAVLVGVVLLAANCAGAQDQPAPSQVSGQRPQSTPDSAPVQAAGPDKPVPKALTTPSSSAPSAPFVLGSRQQSKEAAAINEQDLRQQLQGKTFYLRSGLADNTLHFDEQGHLRDNSPRASYTLSLVEIQRVKLGKHRVEIEAVRYGLHFLGASATEDQTTAVDRVRLSAKKKPLVITIDREQVVKPKKEKEKHGKGRGPHPAEGAQPPASTAVQAATTENDAGKHAETASQAHANQALARALDAVFANAIDDRLIATMPDYWQLFYKSVAEHRNWKPSNAAVLRQGEVDQKAKLVSVIDPPSNEFAQKNGVAGIAMYHVVLDPAGKPQEIVIGRPIGFGLDENAVKAIREAKFQPAMKSGQPVAVELDLLVQFRIYSHRTAQASNQPRAGAESLLPGPYTANAPKPQGGEAGQDAAPQAGSPQQPVVPEPSAQSPSQNPAPQPAQQETPATPAQQPQ